MLAVIAASCSVPDLDDYQERPLAQTTFLYASDGTLITELHAVEDRVVLRRAEMPEALRAAVVAIEDRRFFSHHGIDPEAIVRAAVVNANEGEIVEGGSTITQQLVKLLYVGDSATFRRKWDEALLAWQLEDRFTKDQILTRYLNTVYFGQGAYGAQAAARTYFDVDAEDLTVARSAMLAGLITAPNHFDPFVRPRAAIGRRNVVLRLMRQTGAIDVETFREARRERLVLRHDRPAEARHPYPYFVDYFKRWFLGNPDFGETRADRYQLLFTGGLRITTTIDPGHPTRGGGIDPLGAGVPDGSRRRDDDPGSADRLREGDGGRQGPRLLARRAGRARQPGDGSRRHGSADRIGLQAVRPRRGPRERDDAGDRVLRARDARDRHRTTARCGTSRTPREAATGR